MVSNVLREIADEDNFLNLYRILNGKIQDDFLYLVMDVGINEAISIILNEDYKPFEYNKSLDEEIEKVSEIVVSASETENDIDFIQGIHEKIVQEVGNYESLVEKTLIDIEKHYILSSNGGYNRSQRLQFASRCVVSSQRARGKKRKKDKDVEDDSILKLTPIPMNSCVCI